MITNAETPITSSITSSVIRGNNAFDNGLTGIYIQGIAGNGSISGNIDNNTAINNGSSGIRVRTLDSTTATVSLSGNTTTQNTDHGVFFDDDSTGAITADLGGGGLNSTGNNIIHNNNLTDIRVDLDGAELKAEGNWWGIDTGLSVGEVLLEDGSTIDADPELTSAP